MDDVIRLISSTYEFDASGNEIESITERTVFCKVSSVGRNEFYSAAQNNLHPVYIFTLSHYKDYQNESELRYVDWTGTDRRYTITRTYRSGDAIELTAEERIEDYD